MERNGPCSTGSDAGLVDPVVDRNPTTSWPPPHLHHRFPPKPRRAPPESPPASAAERHRPQSSCQASTACHLSYAPECSPVNRCHYVSASRRHHQQAVLPTAVVTEAASPRAPPGAEPPYRSTPALDPWALPSIVIPSRR
ncbi:extensin-like [Iris pallida]|uniref:Extensin-like n=1 Tax=Iris pallida TaxID=29817 RepID=A0AAX6FFK6_IRIPA|nr:extensin-like [Iris pallida]